MNNKLHQSFKLNGISFSSEEKLLIYAKNISNAIVSFLNDWFNDNDFVIVQTSGSTGKPKLIKLQKKFMKNSAFATAKFFDLPEKTTTLLCLPTDYIAGKMMLVRALTLGWELDIIVPNATPLKDEKLLKKYYDFSAMVPLQLQNSLNNLHKIDKLIVGGGVVSDNLIAKIQGISTKMFATYGMTETITHIAIKKLNNFESNKFFSASHYTVLSNVKITTDARDCLVIEAPNISDKKIVTNDVVRLISKTTFEWLGRYDNVINSGGIKLYPEKIEEKLSVIITARFFVMGMSDIILGEKLILIIENNISVEEQEILKINIQDLKTLTKFEVPKEIYFINKFIETETNKIQRKKTWNLVCKNQALD